MLYEIIFSIITDRSYNVLSRAFYEKLVFYQVTGFTPDLNEGIDMLKKSNKSEIQLTLNLALMILIFSYIIALAI